jgi:hypothetical protein
MDEACGTHEEMRVLVGKRRTDHLEDSDVSGRILLKRICNRGQRCGLDSFDSAWEL